MVASAVEMFFRQRQRTEHTSSTTQKPMALGKLELDKSDIGTLISITSAADGTDGRRPRTTAAGSLQMHLLTSANGSHP